MDNFARTTVKYKSYVVFGNSSQIPARIKRYWARKRRLASEKLQNKTQMDQSDLNMRRSELNRDVPESCRDEFHQCEQETKPGFIDPELQGSETCSLLSPSHNDMHNDGSDQSIEYDTSHDDSYGSTTDEGENEVCVTDASSLKYDYSRDVLIRTLLVMATKMRHKLPFVVAEDIARLANVLSDSHGSQDTKYHWKKILNVLSKFLSIHHFCERCHSYVGEESKNASGTKNALTCQACQHAINMEHNWASGNLLIYLSLTDQLQHLFELKHDDLLYPQVREKRNEHAIEDILDGLSYRKNLIEDMISLNFNVDGTPIFDSSPISVYPVLCTVNELPPKMRGKNMLMCSLWFGKGKPKCMNELLKPFVAEARSLRRSGVEYTVNGEKYVRKCRILVGICDTIARPLVRTSTQFNGEYGCGICLHPGIVVLKEKGKVRVYPIDAAGNPFGEGLRSHQQTLIHAINKEKGIKGRAVCFDIDGFDIIDNLAPDWMHAVTLGVAKQFSKLWFYSKSHGERYHLGRYVTAIDRMMESFKPTLEVSRTPRKITERKYWKAHEWAIWLLFYSLPILNEIAPRKYVEHWSLLVDGISILLQTSIMKSEVYYARQCLYDFVQKVETLYGLKHVSFNVHLLTHLPDSVLKWGPLWTHSAFIYESYNHELKTSVHSSNGVAMQVCDTFRHKYALHRLQNICEPTMTYSEKKYLSNMQQKRYQPKISMTVAGTGIIGKVDSVTTLPRPYYSALRGLDVPIDESQYMQFAQRVMINNEQIHSKKYTRPQKRASYIVLLSNDEVFEIEQFIIVCFESNSQCYAVGKYYEKTNVAAFRHRRLNHLIYLKEICENIAAVNVDMIKEKVTLVSMIGSQVSFACIHPNHFELMT